MYVAPQVPLRMPRRRTVRRCLDENQMYLWCLHILLPQFCAASLAPYMLELSYPTMSMLSFLSSSGSSTKTCLRAGAQKYARLTSLIINFPSLLPLAHIHIITSNASNGGVAANKSGRSFFLCREQPIWICSFQRWHRPY